MPAAPPVVPAPALFVWLGAVLPAPPPDGVIVLPELGGVVLLAEGRPPLGVEFELLEPELSQAARAKPDRRAAAINQLFLSIRPSPYVKVARSGKISPCDILESVDVSQ